MKRFVLITIAGAVLAALVGPRGPLGGFWAPGPEAPQVEGALRAGFVAWNVVENLAFGIGLAVLLLGRIWFVRRTRTAAGATAAWLAAVWLFASWMPHAALHQHIGMRPAALLPVEWVFHGGAILAIAALLAVLAGPAALRPAEAAPGALSRTPPAAWMPGCGSRWDGETGVVEAAPARLDATGGGRWAACRPSRSTPWHRFPGSGSGPPE